MEIKKDILYLSSLCGISGLEDSAAQSIIPLLEKYCDKVSKDNLGNIIAVKKGINSKGKNVMIECHMDEIGLMVRKIDEQGFIHFTCIGGIDSRILLAQQVTVHGKQDIYGVIGAKPPHILSKEESEKTVPYDKMYIDTGLNYDTIKDIVSVGDAVTFDNVAVQLKNDYISSKSLDDRASGAVILDILKKLDSTPLPFDIYAVFAVQEEIGRQGAKTCAYSINPDFAIAIDVCHGETPDCKENTFKTGSGAVISKGPNIHPALVKNITDILDKHSIKYSIDIDAGDTGTDAWAIQVARCGIPTALFSIPIKYMHTSIETMSCSDALSVSDAICEFLKSLKETEDAICF